MFQIDDLVVYGNYGVCKVEEIKELEMTKKDHRKYYMLRPVYQEGNVVYTPVDNVKVPIRMILSKEEMDDLIREIPDIPMLDIADDKKCEEVYKECVQTHSCHELVKMIKVIQFRNQKRIEEGKKISNIEEKYGLLAEGYLFGELAAVLDITKAEAEAFFFGELEIV